MPSRTATRERARSHTRPWYRRWWAALLLIPAAVALLVGLLLYFFITAAVPLSDDIGAAPTTVLDVDGQEIGTLNAQVAQQDVPMGTLPAYVPDAVMAAEDRRFMEHSGISYTGILRALFTNAQAGEIEQGGSTISQQYIKNAQLSNERTFTRKAKEAALAIKLEQKFDKQEILELYLNTIYWGRGAYGIEAASLTYYDKPAAELSLNEAAVLAGIIQAPENLDPLENPEAADRRRVFVLDGMLSEGWIDQATHDAAVAEGLPAVTERATVEFGMGAYYLDAVRRELAGEIGEEKLFRGLTIHTAMNRHMQQTAEAVMTEQLAGQPYTGALVSVDPRSGGVRALVGGPDFAQQPFNNAVRAARQVGSSFKAFTLTALVTEGFSPESRIDAPACLPTDSGEACNFDRDDKGRITVRRATAGSVNTAFMNLQQEVGSQRVIDTARTLGLPDQRANSEGPIMQPIQTLTLGVDEFTPMEMAGAYGTIAAGGVRTSPHLVTRVTDANGEIVYEPQVEQETAVPSNDAYIVTDTLRGVIEGGTGSNAQIGRPAAGKTGTTSNSKDAWFVGYVPQLVTSVWFGTDQPSLPEDADIRSGSGAARVWAAYMAPALEGIPAEDFPRPDLSDKRILNEEPEGSPSPTPTGPTECPPEGGEGVVITLPDGTQSPCPAPSPSPSPSPTPSPTPTPTQDPTSSPLPDPAPTGDGGGDGGGGDGGGGDGGGGNASGDGGGGGGGGGSSGGSAGSS